MKAYYVCVRVCLCRYGPALKKLNKSELLRSQEMLLANSRKTPAKLSRQKLGVSFRAGTFDDHPFSCCCCSMLFKCNNWQSSPSKEAIYLPRGDGSGRSSRSSSNIVVTTEGKYLLCLTVPIVDERAFPSSTRRMNFYDDFERSNRAGAFVLALDWNFNGSLPIDSRHFISCNFWAQNFFKKCQCDVKQIKASTNDYIIFFFLPGVSHKLRKQGFHDITHHIN
jgi:hypothetical protein